MNDLTVSFNFTIAKGDIWIDPDGVSWRVTHTTVERGETRAWFERVLVTSEEVMTLCRDWRRLEGAQCTDR